MKKIYCTSHQNMKPLECTTCARAAREYYDERNRPLSPEEWNNPTLRDELNLSYYDLTSFQINGIILFLREWFKKNKTSTKFDLNKKSYIDVKVLEKFFK